MATTPTMADRPTAAAVAGGSDVLCACAGLTNVAAAAHIAASPGQSFDEFLAATQSGATCTACMLDMECFFVEAFRPATAAGKIKAAPKERRSLKRRLYGLLERLPPKLVFNRSNWMPVLAGPDLQQYLWMSNFPLLFGEAAAVADFDVRFTVRNAQGDVVFRGRERLPVNGVLRHNLTQYLPWSGDSLVAGSVQVDRFARHPAVRGTTRPQTEVVLASSATSLHFQGATPRYDESLSIPGAVGGERQLISAINCAQKTFRLRVDRVQNGESESVAEIELESFQAKLLDVSAPDGSNGPNGDGLQTLRLRTTGPGKLHLIIFNERLGRLSLDHL